MKKILFPILVLVIILGMSDCSDKKTDDYDPMFPDGKPEYLTVTYHKEDKNGELPTRGEPPVDPNHYRVPYQGQTGNGLDYIYDKITILDQGTMEKDGYKFGWWETKYFKDNEWVWGYEKYKPVTREDYEREGKGDVYDQRFPAGRDSDYIWVEDAYQNFDFYPHWIIKR